MAEALGIAASIASLVQIVGQITKISYSVISDIQNATKHQKQYLQEVSALSDVLLRLEQALESPTVKSTLAVRPAALSKKVLEDCYDDLHALQDLLTRRTTSDSRIERFKASVLWPLEAKEIKKQIEILHKYRELFVAAISSDTFTVTIATYDKVDGLTREQDRTRILDWLSHPTPPYPWTTLFDSVCPGTFQWLLEDQKYSQWRDGPSSLFWAFGKPGAGKTYLTSIVLDNLIDAKGPASRSVIYYFGDFSERKEQTTTTILRSWLRQILEQANQSQISLLLQQCSQSQPPLKLKTLTKAFMEASSLNPDTFLIVDALDELDNRKAVFPILRDAVTAGLRVFVTSRDIPDIRDAFKKDCHIEIEASQSDLKDFIDSGLQESELYDTISAASGVIPAIVDHSGGTFLLAKLLVQHLIGLTSVKEIRLALNSLPSSVTEAYQSTLERVLAQSPSQSSLAMRVFGWIAHAQRRLTMGELIHGLAVEEGSTGIDEENVTSPKITLQVCIGLVSVHPQDGTVGLIHTTAYEYFQNLREHYQSIHIDVAKASMTYLCFDSLAKGPCDTIESLSARMNAMPFLRYAAHYWGTHARLAENETMALIRKVLDDTGIRDAAFQALQFRDIQDPELSAASFNTLPKGLKPLHVTAYWNLVVALETLLETGIDVSQPDSQGWSPLHWTCSNGHLEATEMLLKHGANINATDLSGWSPLFWAAFQGHKDLVSLLLDKGADHLLTDSRNWTVLHWTALKADDGIAEVFMRHHAGYVYNMRNRFAGTKYKDLTVEGAKELSRYEGRHGLWLDDPKHDIADVIPESAEMAAKAKDLPTIKAILKGLTLEAHGYVLWGKRDGSEESPDIDVDIPNLWYSYSKRHTNRIFDKKARLLQIAIKSNKVNLVKMMLEMGASPETTINFNSVLHMAAGRKDPQIAKALLDYGAEPEAKHLLEAICKGFEKTAEVFIKAGVDVNTRIGDRGYTPLMAACSCQPLPHDPTLPQRLVELLLDNGANIYVKDDKKITAVDLAIKNGNSHVLKLLLERDEMSEQPDGDKGTNLLQKFVQEHFADEGHEVAAVECLDLLLKCSASRQTDDNREMLNELAKTAQASYNWSVFNALVKKGADVPVPKKVKLGLKDAIKALNAQEVEILTGQPREPEASPQQRPLFQAALDSLGWLKESDATKDSIRRIWHTLLEKGDSSTLQRFKSGLKDAVIALEAMGREILMEEQLARLKVNHPQLPQRPPFHLPWMALKTWEKVIRLKKAFSEPGKPC